MSTLGRWQFVFILFACCTTGSSLTTSAEQELTQPSNSMPCPADYDGDGYTDIAVKGDNGFWYIDVSHDPNSGTDGNKSPEGFGGNWDYVFKGYGNNASQCVPADYDGDGRADLSVRDSSGTWYIDYSSNGFLGWDWSLGGYGDSNSVPVPGRYDSDAKADIAWMDLSGWHIDHASDGFNGADEHRSGYWGNVPAPADYDGDGVTDVAVKNNNGDWLIDYSANGVGGRIDPLTGNRFKWDVSLHGYGLTGVLPVPGDYDGDGKSDVAIKDAAGTWLIDYSNDGFHGWNNYPGFSGYGATSKPTIGHYDTGRDLSDKRVDISVFDGAWYVDTPRTGYGSWDIIPGTNSTYLGQVRPSYDGTAPFISAINIYPSDSTTALTSYDLTIGVRYTVAVTVQVGSNGHYIAGVEANPALQITPAANSRDALNLQGPSNGIKEITTAITHRMALTCNRPGSFPVGFRMRDASVVDGGTARWFNPDVGLVVRCTSGGSTGLYGTVTARSGDLFSRGNPIQGAFVNVDGTGVTTNSLGNWSLPSIPPGPHTIVVTEANHSRTVVVNVSLIAGTGVRVDTPMEEPFPALVSAGMSYTLYIDYARGRNLVHEVTINRSTARLATMQSPLDSSGEPQKLLDIATAQGESALVAINGGYFDPQLKPVGYLLTNTGYQPGSELRGGGGQLLPAADVPAEGGGILYAAQHEPMLTILGVSTNQQIGIVEASSAFLTGGAYWAYPGGVPVWAPNGLGTHSADFALMCDPFLLKDGKIFAGADGSFARTSVGLDSTHVFVTVADGEGLNGGCGTTANQTGHFYRDVLHASVAMTFDSGLSSELVVKGGVGRRILNTIAYESDYYESGYPPNNGHGSVANILLIGH